MNAQEYDSDLHMLREKTRELEGAHLDFLRWLGERGMLEHEVCGPPSGPVVIDRTNTQKARGGAPS